MIKKGQTQDIGDLAEQLIDMIQKIHKGTWSDESYAALRMIAENPDGKWAHCTQRLLRENDPHILKTFLTNAAYEGGFRGYQTAQANAAKYDVNISLADSDGSHLRLQYRKRCLIISSL